MAKILILQKLEMYVYRSANKYILCLELWHISTITIKLLVAKGHLCILFTARREEINVYWKTASFYILVEQWNKCC